ncbi:MAG: hypothetical protein GF417_03140 [Candidatus Latescibacteria bacterium]|nr:hypothetical protein [Candidatus Latescibacterota bacterium]
MKKMKSIRIQCLVLIAFFIFCKSADAREELTSIDSLFISTIDSFYETAESMKDEIWTGMEIGPFCIFRVNGPALLYNHPAPPESFIKISDRLYIGEQNGLDLFGATQADINGTLTAINDYGESRYSRVEEAYAELFHELHHLYQLKNIKQIRFDNPAVLLTYPENYINDGIKLYEQKLLYRICFEKDEKRFRKLLNQFYSCRLKREQIIGDYLQYEEEVENMEGPAFYCEYRFYNQYESIGEKIKKNYNQMHFWGILTTPFYGRNNLRARHLGSGLAMCYILNRKFKGWQRDYYGNSESLYDFFISKFKPQKVETEIDSGYFGLSKFHTSREISGHQASFNRFNSQQGIKITLNFIKHPKFRGFDPMHAESINDSIVLHSTMLRLSGRGNSILSVTGSNVVTTIDEEIWNVRKAVLFAPRESIRIENDRISFESDSITLSWPGRLKLKTEKEIIFNCK